MTLAAFADSPTLNMVQGQIAPNGVTHDAVMETFLMFDRAAYLPPIAQARATMDDNVCDATGALLLLRPLTLAWMIQHLARSDQRGQVAVIGDASGYTADLLRALGFAAIDVADEEALGAAGPWQGILLHGAVPALPPILFPYLEPRGVLLAVVQPAGQAMGDVVAAMGASSLTVLGQAGAPYVEGFAPLKSFSL